MKRQSKEGEIDREGERKRFQTKGVGVGALSEMPGLPLGQGKERKHLLMTKKTNEPIGEKLTHFLSDN